uniref:PIPK domain-containing protein n=1 Tax=Bicosoecida sp. CB-2014 TaxID=1486930 RepID=A0A7S1CBN6_9STRA|mmetsp:Transcript_20865/g.73623  ORF Transcript_20865/g.73623 Transcript_20865/m.73623 type:complete len:625 (+) Transcript_20865:409-2283(+)
MEADGGAAVGLDDVGVTLGENGGRAASDGDDTDGTSSGSGEPPEDVPRTPPSRRTPRDSAAGSGRSFRSRGSGRGRRFEGSSRGGSRRGAEGASPGRAAEGGEESPRRVSFAGKEEEDDGAAPGAAPEREDEFGSSATDEDDEGGAADGAELGAGRTAAPDLTPGSPADAALKAELRRKKKKLHRPEVLARLQDGKEAHERKKEQRKRENEIDREHELYKLTYGIILGLRAATEPGARSDLKLDDFMEVRKYDFPPQGVVKEAFKFKDYSPKAFRQLRERFGIDDEDYRASLCGSYNFIKFISNSKSGQFFFYSYDGRYMIKTQSKTESKFLRRIMPHYYQYVMKQPHTFITRFYGMHRIKIRFGSYRKSLHFVVMQSVYAGRHEIHEQYDLKGSTVGRAATEKEKQRESFVLKDLDLIRSGKKMKFGEARKSFLTQVRRDCKFLAKLKIMDYSLLLGIHYRSKKDVPGVRRASIAPSGESTSLADSLAEFNKSLARGGAGGRSRPKLRRGSSLMPHHLAVDETGELVRPAELARTKSVKKTVVRQDDIFTLTSDGVIEGVEPDGGPADEIYFMGIIDILQQYDTKKTLETFFKSFVHKTLGISSVDPNVYAERFVRFMEDYSV